MIQRCIAKDPGDRPSSALAVAAALPGGDPLAAALAAGETPSPEMVAAAGGVGALRRASRSRERRECSRASPGSCCSAPDPGDPLCAGRRGHRRCSPTRRSRSCGGSATRLPNGDTGFGFTVTDYITFLRNSDPSPSRWENLRPGQPPGFTFWYRGEPGRSLHRQLRPRRAPLAASIRHSARLVRSPSCSTSTAGCTS